jgi:hypothetical protein
MRGRDSLLRAWLVTLVLPEFDARIFPISTVSPNGARGCMCPIPFPNGRPDRGDGSGAWHDGRDPEQG